jgi:hypothetical protein
MKYFISKYYFWLTYLILLYSNIIEAQQFNRAEAQSNLDFISNNNGVAVADFDMDNDLDIFVVGTMTFNENDPTTWSRLLKNNNGIFQDVTIQAGFAQAFNHEMTFTVKNTDGVLIDVDINSGMGKKMGASWGDYNNDGYPDIFLSNANQSQLYKNNGNGTFTDVTGISGLQVQCSECYQTSALWWDYNNDSYLDLYLTDYNYHSDNKLYKNNGNGTFALIMDTNLTSPEDSFSSVSIDINDDGFLDLYVANDFDRNNFLYINQNGNSFVESAISYGVEDPFDGMGLAVSDFDNNGKFEILVSNIKENGFYVPNVNNTFDNRAIECGISDTDWSWGVVFADFDLDGFEDFFVANGFTGNQFDHYYKNVPNASSRFFSETPLTEPDGLEASISRSTVSFDYDNDGDLDLIVTNYNGKLFFYENTEIENQPTNGTSWSEIKLIGTSSNRDAFGAKLELMTDNGLQLSRFHQGSLYQSQSILPVHFGLSGATKINSLTINWPSGIVEVYNDLPVNQLIEIIEGSGVTLGHNDYLIEPQNLKLYPNPILDQDEIKVINASFEDKFLLFDTFGRSMDLKQVFEPQNNFMKLNVGDLASGVYFLTSNENYWKIIIK